MAIQLLTEANTSSILSILNTPKVLRASAEENIQSITSLDFSRNLFMGVFEQQELVGVVRLEDFAAFVSIIHVVATPKAYGIRGYTEVLPFIFNNTSIRKLVAFIPAFNRLTVKLAKDAGFKQEGLISSAYAKNWRMHDLLVFGLSKGELLCPQ